MFRPSMTLYEARSTVREIFVSAKCCRMTSSELNKRCVDIKAELNSRTETGRRRYPVWLSGFVQGIAHELRERIMEEEVEFCYRNEQGDIFSTHKTSTHASTELFYAAGRGSELGDMECAHLWKGTDKPYTAWTVPNKKEPAA